MWSLIRVCKLIVWNGRENSKKELIHNEHLKTTVPMTNTLIKFLFFLIFFIYFFYYFSCMFILFFFWLATICIRRTILNSIEHTSMSYCHCHVDVCSMYRSSLCARLFFSSEIIKKWMNFFRLTTNNSFFCFFIHN